MRFQLFSILFILLLVSSVYAVPGYQDKYVNDFANVLTISQINELRNLFYAVDQNTTAEMVILTVNTVSPLDMSSYAQEVFDSWKIGKADKDNGLLILYAKQENRIQVLTGYGLEGILPDSKVGRILDSTFVPARTNGKPADGIVLAAREYADVIFENADEVRSGQAGMPAIDINMIMFLFFFVLIIISIIANAKPKCPKCKGKTTVVKTEYVREKGFFGATYVVTTYRCTKCGNEFTKKRKRGNGAFVVMGGGGGGFGGGGFGGGMSGGGGAGR